MSLISNIPDILPSILQFFSLDEQAKYGGINKVWNRSRTKKEALFNALQQLSLRNFKIERKLTSSKSGLSFLDKIDNLNFERFVPQKKRDTKHAHAVAQYLMFRIHMLLKSRRNPREALAFVKDYLSKLPHQNKTFFQSLSLRPSLICKEDVPKFLNQFPDLRSISALDINGSCFKDMPHMSELRVVDLSGCAHLLDDTYLTNLFLHAPNLEKIFLSKTQITGSCFQHMPDMPQLKEVSLSHCPLLTQQNTDLLYERSQIKVAGVAKSKIEGSAVSSLAKRAQLIAVLVFLSIGSLATAYHFKDELRDFL